MQVLGYLLSAIGGLGGLVCLILVLIRMFQRGRAAVAILCILLLCCGGVGALVAFILGWVYHREWGLTSVMNVWTGFWVVALVGAVLAPPVDFRQLRIPGP